MKIRTVSAVVMTMLWATTAHADSKSEAEALHKQGVQQMQQKKFAEAAASFRASYAKDQSPRELYNAARAELAQSRYVDAAKLYRTYLSLPANDKMAPSERAEAKAELAEITKNLVTLDVRAPKFTVDGATYEGGLVDVEPGEHRVEMQGPSGPKTKTARGGKGEVVLVEYAEPVAPPPPGPKVLPPPPPPRPEMEKGSWVVPGVLGGVGLVGLGVGIGLGAASSSATSTGTELARGGACRDLTSPACQEARDKESSSSGMSTGSIVGYVVGGGFLAAAVVSAIVIAPWQDREKKTGVWLAPTFGGGALGGTF